MCHGLALLDALVAIVVIGGLITSTLLSLLVIPVVFTDIDDLVEWLRRRFDSGARTGATRTGSHTRSLPQPNPTAP